MTDYPDWTVPQASANAISVTGVPLLSMATLAYQGTLNPAALATLSSGSQSMTQVGYEILVQSSYGVAPTVPFIEVQLEWFMVGVTNRVATDTFIVPASTTPGAFTVRGTGPSKGDLVNVHVTNLDPAQTATVSIALLQVSRTYVTDSWRWDNAANAGLTVTGWTLPSLPPDESVLGMAASSVIGAGGNGTWLCGMHQGLVNASIEMNVGALTALVAQVAAEPGSAYVANNPLYSLATPPNVFQYAAPRAPVRFQLHNNSGAAVTVTWSLVRAAPV